MALRDEYFQTFPEAGNVYGSKEFDAVTSANAEAVRYFIGYDERMRPRMGMIAGYREGQWHAPYSAPFAEVAYTKPQQLERIYDFISELTDMLGAPLNVSLAPDFYDMEMLPKIAGVFGNYARQRWVDFDYYYPLREFDTYIESLDHASRKNLNRAMGLDYGLECTEITPAGWTGRGRPSPQSVDAQPHWTGRGRPSPQSVDESSPQSVDAQPHWTGRGRPSPQSVDEPCRRAVERMYRIIAANRESHGYPLAMSLEQVLCTVEAIGGDCMVLTLDGVDVASALVYPVAEGIVQVIYWGDMPGHTESRPMNMLAYRVFEHYRSRGMAIVDVGPSSTRGIPNSGLCRFKESIGCRVALKPSFVF